MEGWRGVGWGRVGGEAGGWGVEMEGATGWKGSNFCNGTATLAAIVSGNSKWQPNRLSVTITKTNQKEAIFILIGDPLVDIIWAGIHVHQPLLSRFQP